MRFLLAILCALFGAERIEPAPAVEPARRWSQRTQKKTRRAQQVLEKQFDIRLIGGQIVPDHVLDYLHEAKTDMAAGEYGAARWAQRYVRNWLKHNA